jgi:hypothetical protein
MPFTMHISDSKLTAANLPGLLRDALRVAGNRLGADLLARVRSSAGDTSIRRGKPDRLPVEFPPTLRIDEIPGGVRLTVKGAGTIPPEAVRSDRVARAVSDSLRGGIV